MKSLRLRKSYFLIRKRCVLQDGGLQDFLDLGEHAVPWTNEAEAVTAGAPCSRYDLLQADSLAADIDLGWDELGTLSVRRVRSSLVGVWGVVLSLLSPLSVCLLFVASKS